LVLISVADSEKCAVKRIDAVMAQVGPCVQFAYFDQPTRACVALSVLKLRRCSGKFGSLLLVHMQAFGQRTNHGSFSVRDRKGSASRLMRDDQASLGCFRVGARITGCNNSWMRGISARPLLGIALVCRPSLGGGDGR
jgi:hypothetical protein